VNCATKDSVLQLELLINNQNKKNTASLID